MSNVTYEQAVRSREKVNRMRKRNFRVLECSIRGYKSCSPLIAKVTVFGKTFTIEEWYQKSKGVNGAFVDPDRNPYMMRGITPDFYEINRKRFGINFGQRWYNYLWYVYLESNPEVVQYLSNYGDYSDFFRHRDIHYSQAHSIYSYMYDYEKFKKDALLVEQLVNDVE